MPAPTGARTAAQIPAQRAATSGRSPWPDPAPAADVWMAGVGQPDLHRVEEWRRVPATGLIHARCGQAATVLWMAVTPGHYANRRPCIHCLTVDDFA